MAPNTSFSVGTAYTCPIVLFIILQRPISLFSIIGPICASTRHEVLNCAVVGTFPFGPTMNLTGLEVSFPEQGFGSLFSCPPRTAAQRYLAGLFDTGPTDGRQAVEPRRNWSPSLSETCSILNLPAFHTAPACAQGLVVHFVLKGKLTKTTGTLGSFRAATRHTVCMSE